MFWSSLGRRDAIHIALCGAVFLLCGYLRFVNLDWGFGNKSAAGGHPDEPIVVGVVQDLKANQFDTDLKRAPIPAYLATARYNFSAYEYTSYFWYTLTEPVWNATRTLKISKIADPLPPVVIHRKFSALLGLLACIFTYKCALLILPREFAILSALFAGVVPLLVQDSHYARAEAFVTAGTVAVIWMTLRSSKQFTLYLAFWPAFLLGFLIAAKISVSALLYLPLCAAALSIGPITLSKRSLAIKTLMIQLLGSVAGFVLGVPYILVHRHIWWEGWKVMREQYAHPFPPHSPDPDGYCFRFIAEYVWRTFGAALIILAGAGVIRFIRRKEYRPLLFVFAPVAISYFIFGFQESFFERNISHVVPLLAIVAAAGCAEIWDRLQTLGANRGTQQAAIAVVIVCCLWVPFSLSWRIAVELFGGKWINSAPFYDAVIGETCKGFPMYLENLYGIESLLRIEQRLAVNPHGFVLKLWDANDDTSRKRLYVAKHLFDIKLLAAIPSRFADIPVSTLQVYHSPGLSWYFVKPQKP